MSEDIRNDTYDKVSTNIDYNRNNDPELDPFEIEFRQEFRQGRGPKEVFINEHGVLIGDHVYESDNSPLNRWSKDTDPSVMSGDEWVHPYKDVGFQTSENRDLFEQAIPPQGHPFQHPDKDVAYKSFRGTETEQDEEERTE